MPDLRQRPPLPWQEIPAHLSGELHCRIEVPRWSFVKPRADGGVDYVSPLPCPYNYGSFDDWIGYDGDPLDCIVLGRKLAKGRVVQVSVVGIVGLIDRDQPDHKVIARPFSPAQPKPLTVSESAMLSLLFTTLTGAKSLLHASRGEAGHVRYLGIAPAQSG